MKHPLQIMFLQNAIKKEQAFNDAAAADNMRQIKCIKYDSKFGNCGWIH